MPTYDEATLRALLERLRRGGVDLDEAMAALRQLPFVDIGDARVDHHRLLRTGMPEAIYGEHKSVEQIERIARELHERQGLALVTRLAAAAGATLTAKLVGARYDGRARLLTWGGLPRSGARVAVVCAGTSDLPVADEAALTLDALGHDVVRSSDVGVAGLHRLFADLEQLQAVAALVVVAGMEGALPGVVAGLVRAPVIAVPTSVGYGAAFEGLAALLAMLNACAPGVAVVNIDNGFGAAVVVHKMVSATRGAIVG